MNDYPTLDQIISQDTALDYLASDARAEWALQIAGSLKEYGLDVDNHFGEVQAIILGFLDQECAIPRHEKEAIAFMASILFTAYIPDWLPDNMKNIDYEETLHYHNCAKLA